MPFPALNANSFRLFSSKAVPLTGHPAIFKKSLSFGEGLFKYCF
jgi:hypothetical protein